MPSSGTALPVNNALRDPILATAVVAASATKERQPKQTVFAFVLVGVNAVVTHSRKQWPAMLVVDETSIVGAFG